MENRKPLFASPIDAEKHPFQIDGLVGVLGSCQMSPMGFVGFFVRLDMPGVPRNGFRFFKKPGNFVVTFNATAPKKESFPFDESDRVYAGYLNVNRNPLVIPVQVIAQNGSFLMLFPATEGGLYFMPLPRSASAQIASGSGKSDKGEGTSGNSIDEAEGILDKINLDAINLECSGKYGSPKISSTETTKGSAKTKQVDSSGESIDKAEGSGTSESVNVLSQVSAQVSKKSEQQEVSAEKSIDKAEGSVELGSGRSSSNKSAEGSAKFEEGKGPFGKPIDKAEGSGKARLSSSSNEDDEAWILACIKRNILQIQGPELPTEESAPVDTSPTKQSSHEVPEVAIGSIKECVIHGRQCQCQRCDSDGVCLKTWSTTADVIRYRNRLKIKGPDGVCEKRVVQEDGQYSLYLRADLPGLDPYLCVTTVQERCVLVYGKPLPQEYYVHFRGARNYLFFVQLRCSCCKFDNVRQDHEDGVLRLFCRIIGPEPAPSAD